MSKFAAAYRKMVALGLSVDDIAEMLDIIEGEVGQAVPAALEKRRAYDRERKTKKPNSTGIPPENAESNVAPIPPEFHRNSTGNGPPLAGVVDITSTSEITGKNEREIDSAGDARGRLSEVRKAAGDALGDLARCPGIASLHGLTALLSESPACLWREDVLPAVESAAAWHRSRDGPGSMTSWTTAAKMARRNREDRLKPPPPATVHPLERPHESKQSANLSAAQRGAEMATRMRAER